MRDQKEKANLQQLVDEFYKESPKALVPAFPYVLLRVLPRTQRIGAIWTPEKHNKTVLEGIVLTTFRPFWRQLRNRQLDVKETRVECSAKPGDHVLFQAFEGVPVEHVLFQTAFVSTQSYILVAADPVGGGRNGLLGVVEEGVDVEQAVKDALSPLMYGKNWTKGGSRCTEAAKVLSEKFVITSKDQASVTTSGA